MILSALAIRREIEERACQLQQVHLTILMVLLYV